MGKILRDLFDEEAFEKILKWAESSMNYPEKADKIEKLMKKHGLKPLDSGTNRICYTHKDYPRVVFKIGFDPQGILDNLNEYHKASLSEEFASCSELDEEGLILIEEKCPTIDYDFFQKKETKKKIRNMLEKLDKEGFILIDLGLDKHKNYGVDRKGRIRIIDFGYVALKSQGNFSCPHVRYKEDGDKKKYCKGRLKYNKNFTMLECNECGNVFKIDVVLEGYTESKYATPEKLPKYKASKELDEFYKNFTKHRDRTALKQYVVLSNKTDTNKEGDSEVNKNSILSKMQKLSGTTEENVSVPKPKSEPPQQRVQSVTPRPQQERKPQSVYHSTPRGIDVLKPNDEVEKEQKQLLDLSKAFELINTDKTEESDKLIRNLFFARFPGLAEAIEDIKTKLEDEDDGTESSKVHTLCKESGIEIIESNDNELHIAFQYENLQKDPWVVMSHGDVVVHIDLKSHIEKITQIDCDDETELIVSRMTIQPLTEFNRDYEESYFGDEEQEEEDYTEREDHDHND